MGGRSERAPESVEHPHGCKRALRHWGEPRLGRGPAVHLLDGYTEWQTLPLRYSERRPCADLRRGAGRGDFASRKMIRCCDSASRIPPLSHRVEGRRARSFNTPMAEWSDSTMSWPVPMAVCTQARSAREILAAVSTVWTWTERSRKSLHGTGCANGAAITADRETFFLDRFDPPANPPVRFRCERRNLAQ
jgi:hypothetical protein